ncbi:MAG: exopolysaccharide Pel transporter PelG, partial [Myxococcales bacterium]|nr:exopolysaccharide Pel transporter PelG [Myxococcales bacterium]
MAGIGFELRKLLKDGSFFGLLRVYGFAGLISSGPWVLSIVGVMLTGVLALGFVFPPQRIIQFLVSITYLMAGSLVATGGLQLMFCRFVADRLFDKRRDAVLPNLLGALTLVVVVSALIGALVLSLWFDEPLLYRMLMLATFVLLCALWIVVVLLSGLKEYRAILLVFVGGYALAVVASLSLRRFGLSGLLAGFLLGQAAMFFALLGLVVRGYP